MLKTKSEHPSFSDNQNPMFARFSFFISRQMSFEYSLVTPIKNIYPSFLIFTVIKRSIVTNLRIVVT